MCPCDRWLCLDSGDGRIERELHPCHASQDEGAVSTLWTVHVWTSDMRGAGTDANVTIQVHYTHIHHQLLANAPWLAITEPLGACF